MLAHLAALSLYDVVRTGWLLPGSFTVTSCSSLYFSNAGVSCERMSGEDTVKALISAIGKGSVR